MPVYGLRPDDVVVDAAGNVQSGATLTLHATQADAEAGTGALATVTTSAGRWSADVDVAPVWVRTPNGAVYQIEDFAAKADVSYVDAQIGGLSSTYASRSRLARARIPNPQLILGTLSTDVPTRTAGSYPTGYVELPYTTDKVSHGAAIVTEYTNAGFTSYRNSINSTGSIAPWFIEFDYYGQDFSFRGRDNVGANAFLWVWVDGKPITDAPENSGANAINQVFGVRFQWGTKALRRIRIYMRGTDFTALRISPNDFVAASTLTQPRAYWIGDSWLEGAFDVHTLNNYGQQASVVLGWEHFQGGQGGTGYVNNGGGGNKAPFTNAARLAPIGTVQPEYVIVSGSINDDSSSPAAIESAAASVYAQIAALSPASEVIVIGPQSTGDTVSAGRAANRDAVQAAALAAPNVVGFIDPAGDGWITGTGKIGGTTGTGTADIFVQTDGSHLSAIGAKAYGRKAAAAIADLLSLI